MPYTFVPWGVMAVDYTPGLGLPPPTRLCDGAAMPAPALWVPWLDATANDLAVWLWPRWDGASASWVGASVATMHDLTLTDLRVMRGLAPRLGQPAPGAATGVTSRALFRAEDEEPPSAAGLMHYLPAVPPPLLQNFRRWVFEAVRDFGLGAALQLKARLQRPRAYQTTLGLAPATPFLHEKAVSADTPAMVSGHSIQAALALVNVVVRYEQMRGAPMPAAELTPVQDYLIGAGDRRVLAGVHYPSDNVSSWFSALRLCRALLFATTPGNPAANAPLQARAREVLWAAIQRSAVYHEIVAEAGTAGSPYAQVLARLQAEAVPP